MRKRKCTYSGVSTYVTNSMVLGDGVLEKAVFTEPVLSARGLLGIALGC